MTGDYHWSSAYLLPLLRRMATELGVFCWTRMRRAAEFQSANQSPVAPYCRAWTTALYGASASATITLDGTTLTRGTPPRA